MTLERFHDQDGRPYYYVPEHRLAIVRETRDHDLVRGATGNGPRSWWEVRRAIFTPGYHRRPVVPMARAALHVADRRRDCVAWIEAEHGPA